MDLTSLSIAESLRSLREREIGAVELVLQHQKRIAAHDHAVGAFLSTNPDALFDAAHSEEMYRLETPRPLEGIPVAIKDNIAVEGQPLTCASRMLAGFVPPYTATAVERLRARGAVVLGKLNLDEFAMGSSTEHSAYKKTCNPYDLERVPGGSSGGSAAAPAARFAQGTLGSDTGGSIRQPASFCGVVGMKPTYGRVSRWGLVAFASSLDQIGPLTRDVRDNALLMTAVAGHDPRDATSLPHPEEDFTRELGAPIAGLRVGVPAEYTGPGLDPEVRASFDTATAVLESLGAVVRPVALPHTAYCTATYYILATSECSSNLARFDGVRYGRRAGDVRDVAELYVKSRSEGFGPEVQRRIMLGTYCLSAGYYDAYYRKAQQARALVRRDFDAAFADVDVIVTPTSPILPFRFGERTADPLAMYLADICTIAANLAGIPALALPSGLSSGGLPVGLQLMGPAFSESRLYRAAYAYEQARGPLAPPPPLPARAPAGAGAASA